MVWVCTTTEDSPYPEDVLLLISRGEERCLKAHLDNPSTVAAVGTAFSTLGCDMEIPLTAIASGEDVTEKVRALRTWIAPNRVCARCKGLLLPSHLPGYTYQCAHHDEDICSFETVSGKYTPQAFQRFLLEFFSNENMVAQTEFFTKKAPEPTTPSAPLLPFGDDCFLNNSSSADLGTREKIDELDNLELACWNLISDYAKFIGVEIVNKNGVPTNDVSWDVAKTISTAILAEFEKAGVEILYSTEF